MYCVKEDVKHSHMPLMGMTQGREDKAYYLVVGRLWTLACESFKTPSIAWDPFGRWQWKKWQRWQDPFSTTEAGKKNRLYAGFCGFALLGFFLKKFYNLLKIKSEKIWFRMSPECFTEVTTFTGFMGCFMCLFFFIGRIVWLNYISHCTLELLHAKGGDTKAKDSLNTANHGRHSPRERFVN